MDELTEHVEEQPEETESRVPIQKLGRLQYRVSHYYKDFHISGAQEDNRQLK